MNTEQWQMLLEAFGNVASHTYQAAARQAALNAVGAVGIILFTILTGILLIYTYKHFKKQIVVKEPDYSSPTNREVFVGVFVGIGFSYFLLGLPILVPAISTIITYILNPDWAILQTLSTLIQ